MAEPGEDCEEGPSTPKRARMASTDIRKQYRSMLMNLSSEIESRNVCLDQLKFALFDFVINKQRLDDATDAFNIFMELDNAGKISPYNVTLLIAVFKLLWLDALNDIFLMSDYQIRNIQPRGIFSEFRISIVTLSNKLRKNIIKKIAGIFGVPKKKCSNQWKLLQYLQDKGKLHEDNLMGFVEDAGLQKGDLEWHPANTPSTKTADIRKQYRLMLKNLSWEIKVRDVCLDRLKFALFDFVFTRKNLDDATDAYKIFEELDISRNISPDNVNLLIAVFKLLWLDALNDIILKSEYQITNVHPRGIFPPFRISIVTLSNKLSKDSAKYIADEFAVPNDKCSNQWKLLQYLQDKGKLHEGNLMDFVKQAGLKKDDLEWHPSITTAGFQVEDVLLTATTSRNLISSNVQIILNIEEVAFYFFLLGVFCTRFGNNSIVFHISSYDPKTLKNLCKMCLNGQLLQKMSEILVAEEFKQQFLDEWTIKIDEDQFNSAVSKLEVKVLQPQLPVGTFGYTVSALQPQPADQALSRVEDKTSGAEKLSQNQRQTSPDNQSETERTKAEEYELYRDFLYEFSDQFVGSNFRWLRFLLFDLLSIEDLSNAGESAMALFNKLEKMVFISRSNVIILSEIAQLTRIKSAISCVTEYNRVNHCDEEGTVLTKYRKTLFRALRQVAHNELPLLIHYYKLGPVGDEFRDVWDVVYYLERQKLLDETPDKVEEFARLLNALARDILLELYRTESCS